MKKLTNIPEKLEMIGIDISTDFVRLLKLARHENAISIVACTKVPYSKPIENLNGEETSIIKALAQGLDEINGYKNMCAIALPDSAIIMKESMLDLALKEKEIFTWISEEAGRCFNLPPEALAIDFNMPLKAAVEMGFCEKCKVKWVAARKDEVHHKISILERAGLTVKIVDVMSLCLQRVGKVLTKKLDLFNRLVGLVHFEKRFLSLVILKNGEIIHIATQSYQDAIRESVPVLVQIINVFLSTSTNEALNHIFLSGSFFSLEEISNSIQIPVSTLDLCDIFPSIMETCEDKRNAHEYVISLGLAMRIKDVN